MFRNSKPSPTELVKVSKALASHEDVDKILMIPGNHDLPRSKGEVCALEPLVWEACSICVCIETPQCYKLSDSQFQLATLPYPNRAQLAATLPDYDKLSPEEVDRLVSAHVEAILRGLAAQLDPDKPSILLAHISVDAAEVGAERSIMAGRDITIPLHAIPEEFTFVCLGHIHKVQDFSAYGRSNVFYCGSTDRIDFGEEDEEKSYVMIDLKAMSWERVPIPCRRYKTFFYSAIDSNNGWWSNASNDDARDAIVRIKLSREENTKPDYDALQLEVEEAGCFDFQGFVEDVQRVASVRSEEIIGAQTLEELLGVWHESKSCQVPLSELVPTGVELERKTLG